jgi:hypothetical protein
MARRPPWFRLCAANPPPLRPPRKPGQQIAGIEILMVAAGRGVLSLPFRETPGRLSPQIIGHDPNVRRRDPQPVRRGAIASVRLSPDVTLSGWFQTISPR